MKKKYQRINGKGKRVGKIIEATEAEIKAINEGKRVIFVVLENV